jgi:PAS domain-containing protein
MFNDSQAGKLAQNIDWSSHKLGPVNQWTQDLKLIVSLVLDSQFPMFISWVEDRVFLYNDAYAPILGKKHPQAFGRTFHENWNEIWDDIFPLVQKIDNGEALYLEDLKLFIDRCSDGKLDEAYFTFSYSPIRNEQGKIKGLYCACFETTEKLKRRRQLEESETLFKLASEATRDAIWDWNLVTDDVAWNETIHTE